MSFPHERASGFARFWPYALLLAVGSAILFPALGEFGFWDPWEPKYAESAREMAETGSYIVPYYRYEVRLTKPILVYWGILAGAAVFGLNELGARFTGVACALGAMCALYYAVSTLRGRRAGLYAGLVLATLPQFYFVSRQAMPDIYLLTSIGGSLVFFGLGAFGPPERRGWHFAASYACCGLAVLAKGPLVTGAILGTTLAVFAAITVPLHRLWEPDTRLQTVRTAVAAAVGTGIFFFSGALAYLFGTSSMWWGYDSEQRRSVGASRQNLLETWGRLHVSEILLLAAVAAGAYFGYAAWKNRDSPWRRSRLVASALAAALAIVGLFAAIDTRAAIGHGLFALAGAILAAGGVAGLLRQPGIRDDVAPWFSTIGRELVRFALVFGVVAGPWHIAILLKQGSGYMTDFIVKHNVNRVTSEINQSGVGDFYLRTLLFGYFPWSALIPLAFVSAARGLDRDRFRHHGFEVLLLVGSLVTFTVFTSSITKFPHYLAPMLVPMAGLLGIAIARVVEEGDGPRSRLAWISGTMLFLLPAMDLMREGGVRYLVNSFSVKRYVPDELEPGGEIALLFLGIAACWLLFAVVRARALISASFVFTVLFSFYNTAYFIPELSRHKSLKTLIASYHELRPPEQPTLGFYGAMKHGIFFYTKHDVDTLPGGREFLDFMNPENPRLAIMEKTRYYKMHDPFVRRFRGGELFVVDDSHFQFVLVSNYRIPGLTNPEAPDEPLVQP